MNFLTVLFFGFVTYVYGNAIHTGRDPRNLCPPPENIEPCTCFIAPVTQRLTARCANFTNAYKIKEVFDRNPQWHLQDVWIDQCVMTSLPAKMLETAHFQDLNVTSTSLITLFDTTLVKTPKLNLYLTDVRLLRGFQWKSIANANLGSLRISNMKIKSFGQDFKDNIPKGVRSMWFVNTEVTSIKFQAFSVLKKLEILFLRGGSLKKVSRDMFPKPSNLQFFDLSYQKIADLPEDFFVDTPKLIYFYFEGNYLTTISEKVFTNHKAVYLLKGNPIECNCYIRWITIKLNPKYLHGECAEPKSLRGTKLGDLKMETFRYCH